MPHPKKPPDPQSGQSKVNVINGRAVIPGTNQPIGFRPGEEPDPTTGRPPVLGSPGIAASNVGGSSFADKRQAQINAGDITPGGDQRPVQGPNQPFGPQEGQPGDVTSLDVFGLFSIPGTLPAAIEELTMEEQINMLAAGTFGAGPAAVAAGQAALRASKFLNIGNTVNYATKAGGKGAGIVINNIKNFNLFSKGVGRWVSALGITLGVGIMTQKIVDTYGQAAWARAEGIEALGLAARDMAARGTEEDKIWFREGLAEVEALNMKDAELFDRIIPGWNTITGTKIKTRGVVFLASVLKRLADSSIENKGDEAAMFTTFETDFAGSITILENKFNTERVSGEIAVQNIKFLANNERNKANLANYAKQLRMQEDFNAERARLEDIQRGEDAAFWLEYRRQLNKMFEENRPSTLGFGLL